VYAIAHNLRRAVSLRVALAGQPRRGSQGRPRGAGEEATERGRSQRPDQPLAEVSAVATACGIRKVTAEDEKPSRYANGHPEGAPFEHYGPLQSPEAIAYAREIIGFVRAHLA
jgi:hypothetical protein